MDKDVCDLWEEHMHPSRLQGEIELSLDRGKEAEWGLCRDDEGTLVVGPTWGGEYQITPRPSCPTGMTRVATLHTHPDEEKAELSTADKKRLLLEEPIMGTPRAACVASEKEAICKRVKEDKTHNIRRLQEKYMQIDRKYHEVEEEYDEYDFPSDWWIDWQLYDEGANEAFKEYREKMFDIRSEKASVTRELVDQFDDFTDTCRIF